MNKVVGGVLERVGEGGGDDSRRRQIGNTGVSEWWVSDPDFTLLERLLFIYWITCKHNNNNNYYYYSYYSQSRPFQFRVSSSYSPTPRPPIPTPTSFSHHYSGITLLRFMHNTFLFFHSYSCWLIFFMYVEIRNSFRGMRFPSFGSIFMPTQILSIPNWYYIMFIHLPSGNVLSSFSPINSFAFLDPFFPTNFSFFVLASVIIPFVWFHMSVLFD